MILKMFGNGMVNVLIAIVCLALWIAEYDVDLMYIAFWNLLVAIYFKETK